MNATPIWQRERMRQQQLVDALLQGDAARPEPGLLDGPPERVRCGIQAYVANAGAAAERALAASFPTLQALLGDDAFAGLSRAFWRTCPPTRGDLAWLGEHLPAFVEADPALAGEPYLADSARLDWAIAQAESAADADLDSASLALLGEADPVWLRLQLRPGLAVVRSDFPVVTLWRAHREADDGPARVERFIAARDALAAGRGECAVVAREGWRAEVQAVSPAAADFTSMLLADRTLAEALSAAGEPFDFTAWLSDALTHAWLIRVRQSPVDSIHDRNPSS